MMPPIEPDSSPDVTAAVTLEGGVSDTASKIEEIAEKVSFEKRQPNAGTVLCLCSKESNTKFDIIGNNPVLTLKKQTNKQTNKQKTNQQINKIILYLVLA